jgi:hypothetical protein
MDDAQQRQQPARYVQGVILADDDSVRANLWSPNLPRLIWVAVALPLYFTFEAATAAAKAGGCWRCPVAAVVGFSCSIMSPPSLHK